MMNTQVCIDALREIRAELPKARQAGDLKTLRWIADMTDEVERLARSIRQDAQEGIQQWEAQAESDGAEDSTE